jgi:SAM-dependent methyltransferase
MGSGSINSLLAQARATIAQLRPRKIPHFVRDYRLLARRLVRKHGAQRAMELGVGGQFDVVGDVELALLQHLGLKPGHTIIDVGCGSGRLAKAISAIPGINYHGTDVVEPFLVHARAVSSPRFRFTLVDGLTIPDGDGAADFVTMFSVITHLHAFEAYLYLEDARRVLKPGGQIVVSFLEILNPHHWDMFVESSKAARAGKLQPLNAFVEVAVIEQWASHLGLSVVHMFRAGTPFIPLKPGSVSATGETSLASFAHSVAVLRKP